MATGNHETSDEIMPTTKLPHRFSGEAAVPVNNTVYNTCVYYLCILLVYRTCLEQLWLAHNLVRLSFP